MAATQAGGQRVTFTRRFFGDDWLEGILQLLTLGLGWLAWFRMTARQGRSPAKQLLHVYIHDIDSGDVASTSQVWLREIVAKYCVAAMAGLAVGVLANDMGLFQVGFALYYLGGGAVSLFNDDRRALWDFAAGTFVLFHPGGLEQTDPSSVESRSVPPPQTRLTLRELDLMRYRGQLDEAEYRAKRREIIAR
jgi:uncharacterized RDD family membrane protein YckC